MLLKASLLTEANLLVDFTTSAKRAATTANVIPNTIIIIVILSLLYYSLFYLFECKGNAFLCTHTIFLEEIAKKASFLDFRQFLS